MVPLSILNPVSEYVYSSVVIVMTVYCVYRVQFDCV